MCIPQSCDRHENCPFFERCEKEYHYCTEIQCSKNSGNNRKYHFKPIR